MTRGQAELRIGLGRLWRWGRWVIALLIVGGVTYQMRLAPIIVPGAPPTRQTIVSEVMGTGTLEARISTTISPKISGRISQVLVDQGEAVQQDQLLVQLDDEELRQQVAIAKANLEATQAALQRLKAGRDRSVAVYDQAKSHHGRTLALLQKNAISREEADRAVESLAVATAEIARDEAAISEGQKNLLAAEKTLEYHRARLADTKINAPFAGLIVSREREAGDIAVPGSAILTLISTDVLWIRAWVDETEMSKVAVKQPGRIVFRSEPEHGYPGAVVRMGKQADRETREFVVDVQASQLPTNWAVGQRAEVFIETGRRADVLAIPLASLTRRDEQDGVFVAQDGIVHWRAVTVGLRGHEYVEVLKGLTAQDLVLRPGAETLPLSDGRRVHVP